MIRTTLTLLFVAIACLSAPGTVDARNYAVLISGGATSADDAYTNSEYWYDMFLAYEMLIETGYDHDDIFVLYGNGTEWNSSHVRYRNPYLQPMVDYSNNKIVMETFFASLNDVLNASDQLFVWWLGHGSQSGGNVEFTIENYGQTVMDYEFEAYLDQIEHCGMRVFSFMTCFSGGVINNLEGFDSIVMTSSDFFTSSVSDWLCEGPHCEFHYHETNANHWTTPFDQCGEINADTNMDSKISFSESYAHAATGTTTNPQFSDLGGHAQSTFMASLGISCQQIEIDDDQIGLSFGNGNGIIEYGETVELTITLENLGYENLSGVTGQVALDDPYLNLLVMDTNFGDLPAGGVAVSDPPLVAAISCEVPDGYQFPLTMLLNEPTPEETVGINISAAAPELIIVAFSIDDTAGGDGDGLPEAGEVIDLSITVRNEGAMTAEEVSVVFGGEPQIDPEELQLHLGSIPADAEVSSDPIGIAIAADTPEVYAGTLTAIISGANQYSRVRPIIFNVGNVFTDDMETGDTWTHFSGDAGYIDQWHLESYRNHTFGGALSWKCGGNGAAGYSNLVLAVLESAPFILEPGCHLSIWHWMEAETSSQHAGYCYDGGFAQISIDGGPWEILTPDGGYNYLIRGGSIPGFPAEMPVWSGSFDWEEAMFDLSGYRGTARVRFTFGSDSGLGAEGWYIDDVMLIMETFSHASDETTTRKLSLTPLGANPVIGITQLRLELPSRALVSVRVFDASGRAVRTLPGSSLSAGSHQIEWDGRYENGTPAGAGVYWIRADVAGQSVKQRLIRIR
jgi:FlgD Ig-like domain/Peptidase C13 family